MREHVLLPSVRMASIIRSLTSLAETLRCTLQQIDEDTGEVMVDIRNTELYLKVINQIHSVYKTDATKMLFGPQQQLLQPAASPASANSQSQSLQQHHHHSHNQSPAVPAGPSNNSNGRS